MDKKYISSLLSDKTMRIKELAANLNESIDKANILYGEQLAEDDMPAITSMKNKLATIIASSRRTCRSKNGPRKSPKQ